MYKPTIQLTDKDISALHNGTLTIQCGQWVQLPHSSTPSRYVGRIAGGTLYACHTYRKGSHNVLDGGMMKFKRLAQSIRR